MVWYGMAWYGMVWYGMVWFGMVWYGMVWYGMVLEIAPTVPLNRNSVEYLKVLVERIRENNPQTIIQVGQYQNIYIHTFIKIKKSNQRKELPVINFLILNHLVLAISGRLLKSFRHRICF